MEKWTLRVHELSKHSALELSAGLILQVFFRVWAHSEGVKVESSVMELHLMITQFLEIVSVYKFLFTQASVPAMVMDSKSSD